MKTSLLLCTLLTACSIDFGGNGGSPGQLGHAKFDYGCQLLGDCGVADHELADSGAHHGITVTMDQGYSFTSIQSSDPSVAQLTLEPDSGSPREVQVITGHPGTTDLILLDSSGGIVDRATLTVVPTATLQPGWSGRPQVVANSTHHVKVTTLAANGDVTIGSGSVKFDVSGALTGSQVFELDDGIEVSAMAPGTGHVSAHVDNATADLDLDIVPASAITSVSASNRQDFNNGELSYDVAFATANGPVYAGECDWSMSDPSVGVDNQAPSGLEGPAITIVVFNLGKSGDFKATCSIGSASPLVIDLSR